MENTTSKVPGISGDAPAPRTVPEKKAKAVADKRVTPASRMAKLARSASARGFMWTAFYNLYAAAVVEGDKPAGFQLADVLIALRPTHPLPELEEAFRLALDVPWTRPASLTRPIVDYLMLDRRVERVTEDLALSLDDLDATVSHLAASELFAALLQTCVASDLRLERLLMALRDHLLAVAPTTPGAMRLAALIATQANMVEYLWPYATGPIETTATPGNTPPPITGARALLNSMFRAPTATEIGAIESIAADPAISCLLARVRDDPAVQTRHRDEIERAAVCLGTSALDRRDQPLSCTRWIKAPLTPRKLPLAV